MITSGGNSNLPGEEDVAAVSVEETTTAIPGEEDVAAVSVEETTTAIPAREESSRESKVHKVSNGNKETIPSTTESEVPQPDKEGPRPDEEVANSVRLMEVLRRSCEEAQNQTRYDRYRQYEEARNAERRLRRAYLRDHPTETRTKPELDSVLVARARAIRNYKYKPVKKRASRETHVKTAAEHNRPKKKEANKNIRFGNDAACTPVKYPPLRPSGGDDQSLLDISKTKNCETDTNLKTVLLSERRHAETEDVTSPNSVEVVDQQDGLKTPRSKRRRQSRVPAPTTNDNTVDLVDSSPYVPDVRRAELTIELSENDKTGHLVLIDCTTGGLVLKRLTVSPMFRDSVSKLEAGLSVLKGPDERKATTECVKMILRLGSTKDSIESLEADLSGHDIHELLHNGAFLTDSPIDYYRCLLIREEMKRALIFHQDKWGRSWIQTTFFMSLLLKRDEENNRFVDYDAVKMIERRFLGNRNSNFEIYEDNAPHFFLLV